MRSTPVVLVALLSFVLAACGDDDGGGDGSTGMDGRIPGVDGSLPDGSVPDGSMIGMDGSMTGMDGSTTGMDGSTTGDAGPFVPPDAGPCFPAACSGMVWACANCIDDDGDGLLDAMDPDCTGACDNNEAGYELMIPGSDTPNCNLDCYYDDDQGSGNDRCEWDSRCDPLGPEAPTCPFTGPGMGVSCPSPQRPACLVNCLPITPNGCDCFGCCELPAGSGSYVFLGSRADDGEPPCSADTATSPASCRACTPVMDCFNACGRCEVCLGGSPEDIPCDCFEPGSYPPRCLADAGPPPDAGGPADAGEPFDAGPDAGPPFDAGPGMMDAGMPPMRCPTGRQPCGQPTDPVCPAGEYCQTGCCVIFM